MDKHVDGGWSKAESRKLKRLCAQPGSLLSKVGKIRGRSYQAMKKQRIKLGLGKSRVAVLVRDLMVDGEIRTSRQIATALGRGHQIVNYALRKASEEGERQEMHIVDFLGGSGARRYVKGPGQNAVANTVRARCFSTPEEREEDEKYRASDKWWPRADPAVISAMNAMMFAGRSAA